MSPDPVLDALHAHFGFADFRPGQAEAVHAALADRDVLVVMPTGAGKSLCYQLPALMREDLTLVVSPLVSLMEDQVQALSARAPGRVALVCGQQDAWTNEAAVDAAVAGEVRVLYVAPERFSSPGFAQAMSKADVGLFVVDEAHCVSQWGHDFRPDYFRLADAARWLGAKAIVASTATATPAVAGDIVDRLALRDPVRVATGFDRPNLSFVVVPSADGAVKQRQLVAALSQSGATPAIVYAGTRNGVDETARVLEAALGREVVAYHAGLGRTERAAAQRRFMGGDVGVVVATNAFGMGVDKADVRTVIHATVPSSVEAFYQEAGRAGRDGEPARALLLAASRDKGLHVFFIERAEVSDAQVAAIARRIEGAAGGPPSGGAAPLFDVAARELVDDPADVGRVAGVVGALGRAGVLQPAPAPVDRVRGRLLAAWDGRAAAACREIVGDAHRARWAQYRSIWGLVEGDGCRRATVLRHFGDRAAGSPSGACCDVCDPRVVPEGLREAGRARGAGSVPVGDRADLDAAVIATVSAARPPVGRTRVVEILRGGRSQAVVRHGYDALESYAAFAFLSSGQVLGRVDALLAAGRLASTGGAYPTLVVPYDEAAAA